MLGLEAFLKRKPRALSGGQRQRVAMGRAIVRQPAGLPDGRAALEPRRQAPRPDAGRDRRLQNDLGTTTIYVTHDQVEAMTMGDRVAVMRKGELQQVDSPQELYDQPGQPLRRRLHRQPRDEHARGDARARERRADRGRRRASGSRSARRRSPPARHSRATRARPSSSASGPRTSRTPRLRATRRKTAGSRGRSSCARRSAPRSWCTSPSTRKPAVTEDVKELARDVGEERATERRRRKDDDGRALRRPHRNPAGRARRGRRRHARPAFLRPRERGSVSTTRTSQKEE